MPKESWEISPLGHRKVSEASGTHHDPCCRPMTSYPNPIGRSLKGDVRIPIKGKRIIRYVCPLKGTCFMRTTCILNINNICHNDNDEIMFYCELQMVYIVIQMNRDIDTEFIHTISDIHHTISDILYLTSIILYLTYYI